MATLASRFLARKAGQVTLPVLTAAASVGVPTKVEFDKVVADLVALRAALVASGIGA